jgi:ribonuclease Z
MGLQGREEPLRIVGPKGSGSVLGAAINLGVDRVPFDVSVQEVDPGDAVAFEEYEVVPFAVRHGTAAVGYALREHARLGRFDVERARELGVPEGRLFGQLHRGEPVVVDGRTIRPEEVVGEPRPGRLVAYTGDTRPTKGTKEIAFGADVLIHEATFTEEEADRAHETFHATGKGAALLARETGVRQLILTHVSARYSEDPGPLLEEAKEVFQNTSVAYDGMRLELGYRKEEAGEETGPSASGEDPKDG